MHIADITLFFRSGILLASQLAQACTRRHKSLLFATNKQYRTPGVRGVRPILPLGRTRARRQFAPK